MATPVLVNRVRTNLYNRKYQGFTKDQIIEAATKLNIDINNPNPSKEDTKAVADYLIEHSSSNITPSENSSENEEVNKFISVTEMNSHKEEVNQEQLNRLKQLPQLEPEPQQESNSITHAEKTAMVASQAQTMGITISQSDAELIVGKIDFETKSLSDLLSQIKMALTAYIRQTEATQAQMVTQTFNEIFSERNRANQRVTQILSDGFNQFASEVADNGNVLKSNVAAFIGCFPINKE